MNNLQCASYSFCWLPDNCSLLKNSKKYSLTLVKFCCKSETGQRKDKDDSKSAFGIAFWYYISVCTRKVMRFCTPPFLNQGTPSFKLF